MSVSGVRAGVCMIAFGVSLMISQSAWSAAPEDWSSIEQRIVRLFYPGQSSYQWLRGKEHQQGAKKVIDGAACTSCHEEEEGEIGVATVKAGKLEPTPIEGKVGSIDLLVQAAYDSENAYLRFQWKTANSVPGTEHPQFRFDGKAWAPYGVSKMEQTAQLRGQPAMYEDRLSLMIDDGSVPMFASQGCWLTCHDGMADMKHPARQQEIDENPVLGARLHATEVRKYLPASRRDIDATWSATKSENELSELMSKGYFVDLMQWHGQRSNAVGMADDGFLLEYMTADEGQNVYTSNWNTEKNQPLYMFDKDRVGFKSRTVNDLHDNSKPVALIPESDAVPFDENATWKEGDLIPQFLESRVNASGSAADNQSVDAQWTEGTWTVVWTRKLNTGHADDKVMNPGGVIVVGFAVHDDNVSSRGHFVSFPVTLGFGKGTGAAITAHTLHAGNAIAISH